MVRHRAVGDRHSGSLPARDARPQLALDRDALTQAAASFIGRHRRSKGMLGLHRLARFYEAAWRNEGSDFAHDSERVVLERLQAARLRLAFDVGANVGHWGEAIAGLWPDAQVHAFEVAPETFADLGARLAPLVLAGAAETLAQRRVKLLQFEYGAFSIDTRFLLKDFFALLGGQFWIGEIYPTHVDFADYDWRNEDFRFANYLCVSRDHPELRRLLDG